MEDDDDKNPLEEMFAQMRSQHAKCEHKNEGMRLQLMGALFGEDRENINERALSTALDSLAVELMEYLFISVGDDKQKHLQVCARIKALMDYVKANYSPKLLDIKTGYVSTTCMATIKPLHK